MKRKLTAVSVYHYVRLVYRSALFLALLAAYLIYRFRSGEEITKRMEEQPLVLTLAWVIFAVEMVLRFFPSRLESPGCQKQFRRNYIKSGKTEIVIHDNNSTVLVALIWIVFNGIFGALRMLDIFDDGIMILLCAAYSVCDMICILFFCPFQTWFLKNKCCRAYAWSLLALSVLLLVRWEITFYRHPERFSENTNDYLRCANCTEKLCRHKKQLQSLWKQVEEYTAKRLRALRK